MIKYGVYINLIFLAICIHPPTCFSQAQSAEPKYKWLTLGRQGLRENAVNVVGQKWGIEFYLVSGACVVSKSLVDSVNECNRKEEFLISLRYGKDWRNNFEQEVVEEFRIENKVYKLVQKLDYIKAREGELYWKLSPVKTSTYHVTLQGLDYREGVTTLIILYNFLVDLKEKSVKLINGEIKVD